MLALPEHLIKYVYRASELLPAGIPAFLLTFLLHLIGIARESNQFRALFKSHQFWLYCSTHGLIGSLAAVGLWTTTDWNLTVVVIVAVLGGVTVLRSFSLRFAEAEFELSDIFDNWREDVVTDVQEAHMERQRAEHLKLASELENAFSGEERTLGAEARKVAESLEDDADEILGEVGDEDEEVREFRYAYFIASTATERAEELVEAVG